MNSRPKHVAFVNRKLESAFESLKEGKFQDKKLYNFIERAVKDLKENPICGTKIHKKLWPKVYIKNFEINNLWKYDLPDGWRLVYTIKADDIMILSVILEWFDHKEYNRRFNY